VKYEVRMLSVLFLNDSTGDFIEGNYKWKVMLNQVVLAEGIIKGHNRLSGWQGLVKYFAESVPSKGEKKRKSRKFTIKERVI
jgi:hypothetical protein